MMQMWEKNFAHNFSLTFGEGSFDLILESRLSALFSQNSSTIMNYIWLHDIHVDMPK